MTWEPTEAETNVMADAIYWRDLGALPKLGSLIAARALRDIAEEVWRRADEIEREAR
jgi:hypothetical protein